MLNKKQFSPYIRVAMHSTLRAPYSINERTLFDYEMILVQGGLCNIVIEGMPYLCRKNDVVLLPPGVSHRFECVRGEDFVQPHIHFDVIYDEYSDRRRVSWNVIAPDKQALIHPHVLSELDVPYVFTPARSERFHQLFFEILSIYQKKEYNYELRYKAAMLELLALLCEQFDAVKSEAAEDGRNAMVAVKSYIDNNYLSIITLDLLSAQFYMNKFTLMRRFRTAYRQNVIDYYRGLRVEYAKRALETTNLSIAAIGERMNFSDIYSFSRFFKAGTGIAPSNYRKKFK